MCHYRCILSHVSQHSFIFITVTIIVIVLLFLSPHSQFILSCWVLLSMAELILNWKDFTECRACVCWLVATEQVMRLVCDGMWGTEEFKQVSVSCHGDSNDDDDDVMLNHKEELSQQIMYGWAVEFKCICIAVYSITSSVPLYSKKGKHLYGRNVATLSISPQKNLDR